MLVDANLLIYAADADSPFNARASVWLQDALNGNRRVAFPWQSIGAFLRIATHPRIMINPMTPAQAVATLNSWLAAEAVWIPSASERTVAILAELIAHYHVTGNLMPDAQLAALAIEQGLTFTQRTPALPGSRKSAG